PFSFEVTDRLMLVASLVSVISAPGTTPPGSLTVPRRPPWNPWPAASRPATAISRPPSNSATRNLMAPPLQVGETTLPIASDTNDAEGAEMRLVLPLFERRV